MLDIDVWRELQNSGGPTPNTLAIIEEEFGSHIADVWTASTAAESTGRAIRPTAGTGNAFGNILLEAASISCLNR